MYGPAGAGKSAIAQSFCHMLKDKGCLGGSFFFKHGHSSRGNAVKLFPTIAYQLALLIPELGQLISLIVEKDPAIMNRSLAEQLHRLIIEPCLSYGLSQPVSIVIDGLDECDGQHIQEDVLRFTGNAVCRGHPPIRFFIASRPESHICESFLGPGLNGFHRTLNINQSFQDVHKYLVDEFDRIHREHRTMARVPSPWPSSGIVDYLVEKSSGYFIYVSTVIKFIDDKRFWPMERLDIILGIKNTSSASPFDTLDQLYHQILGSVPIDFHPQFLGILTAIRAELELSVYGLEQLFKLNTGDVCLILRSLHCIINIPEDDHKPVYVHHASFLDFLDSPSRSGVFCVGSAQCHTDLACHILKALSYPQDDPSQRQVYFGRW